MDSDLIFDIGMYKGFDSEFYLKKGFRVVALEASSALCKETSVRCKKYVESGKLIIINKALYSRVNNVVSFFINPKKDDWGSLYKWATEQHLLGTAVEMKVETVTLNDLISAYGLRSSLLH